MSLAWKHVANEAKEGVLGTDFDRSEIQAKVADASDAAKDEVWAGYRFIVLSDNREPDGLRTIDLGAGHSNSGETLCGRIIAALKSEALLNETIGSGWIDRHWPPALKESGAWPLTGLRQSFLDGSLTGLLDTDRILKSKIVEFVSRGDFGLASGEKTDATFERVWFAESVTPEEVAFEPGVFLLTKSKAKALKIPAVPEKEPEVPPEVGPQPQPEAEAVREEEPTAQVETKTLRVVGTVPPEVWNRLGTKVLPKLRSGTDLRVGVDFFATFGVDLAKNVQADLHQILDDLGLADNVRIESTEQ